MKENKHPLLAGVVALVSVAVAVGLVLGLGAMAATKFLGIGGGEASASGEGASLVVPEPESTAPPSGPAITLDPVDEESDSTESTKGGDKQKKDKKKQAEITLQAGQSQVSAGGRIDLSGSYPQGEGKVLKVQRKVNGSGWQDFPVHPMAVSGGQFATYVITSQTGVNHFRMVEVDKPKHTSNVVKVRVG